MSATVSTDFLLRVAQATPEQQAAIERILAGRAPVFRDAPPKPRYALHKDCGYWRITFDGQDAVIKHERGMFYVAWLLLNAPDRPIHAIDLAAKIPEFYRQQLGIAQLTNPATGKAEALQSHARLQERSLALDDAQAMRALFRKERELEATLEDDLASEPEKAEALRDLEAIAEFERRHSRGSRDSARRAAHAVRSAIARLQRRLAGALGRDGAGHPVLRGFADHIERYIVIPSARYAGKGGGCARTGVAGCFTYEASAGVSWAR